MDTTILIYELEANPRYVELTHRVFEWIEQPGHTAVTSTITMTELLVHPYRAQDEERANSIYALLVTYPHLEWIAPELEIADLAAQFRARYNMRTPDAIQAATAARSGCSAFVTNDSVFERVPGFETVLLDG